MNHLTVKTSLATNPSCYVAKIETDMAKFLRASLTLSDIFMSCVHKIIVSLGNTPRFSFINMAVPGNISVP